MHTADFKYAILLRFQVSVTMIPETHVIWKNQPIAIKLGLLGFMYLKSTPWALFCSIYKGIGWADVWCQTEGLGYGSKVEDNCD